LDYESDFAHVSVLYSTVSQEIYSADVSVKREAWDEDKKPYRWLNSEYKHLYYAEAEKRNIHPNKAWDDTDWVDLEVEEDFLEKATAIFNGQPFDNRVQVPLDLDDDLIIHLAMEAHKRDITLNKMVEEVLRNVIKMHDRNL